jgi:hypothetical protein
MGHYAAMMSAYSAKCAKQFGKRVMGRTRRFFLDDILLFRLDDDNPFCCIKQSFISISISILCPSSPHLKRRQQIAADYFADMSIEGNDMHASGCKILEALVRRGKGKGGLNQNSRSCVWAWDPFKTKKKHGCPMIVIYLLLFFLNYRPCTPFQERICPLSLANRLLWIQPTKILVPSLSVSSPCLHLRMCPLSAFTEFSTYISTYVLSDIVGLPIL